MWYFVYLLLVFALRSEAHLSDKWDENVRPKMVYSYLDNHQTLQNPSTISEPIYRFLGNHTHSDYFKLLKKEANSLLIGARNMVYNLSLPTLEENKSRRITWDPKLTDQELCLLKGKQEVDCQNYIRVLEQIDDNTRQLLVCGTNAYNPMCRHYMNSQVSKEFSGRGVCPYDPRHNSTAIYADGELYAGTVADFSATDPLILKRRLRTEQYDLKHLNEPHFVNSLEDEDHVYFFFRESAVEFMNCGKAIYSRVARVCKSDQGGPHKFRDNWTSFLKTRLNCSVPGDHPFYFDEIQSTSGLIDGHFIYGVFTTPDNSISGSAICGFSIKDISKSLDDGPFKGQSTLNSNWLPMSKSAVPTPRPGKCQSPTTDEGMNFIKRHVLMDRSVPSFHQMPLFIKTSLGERLTVIAVDPRVPTIEQTHRDVIFVGTTRGRVLKLVNSARNHHDAVQPLPVLIEALQVFPYHVPVKNLLVVRESGQLIVLSEQEVSAIALHRCHLANNSCGDCVALQDPYCAWHIRSNTCLPFRPGQNLEQLQNVNIGFHPQCPVPIEEFSSTSTSSTSETPKNSMTSSSSSSSSSSTESNEVMTTSSQLEVVLAEKENNNNNLLEETTIKNDECSNCLCNCNGKMQESSEVSLEVVSTSSDTALASSTTSGTGTAAEDEFVDLFDLYNQTDLKNNGVFDDAFYDQNSLGVLERQEKELSIFYEDIDDDPSERITEESAPKVFSSELNNSYSEETLTFAIIVTAFLALLLGIFMGVFVTKFCSTPSSHKNVQKESPNSNDNINRYSVTTLSSSCEKGEEYNQISRMELESQSLPPTYSVQNNSNIQPMSLNPVLLEGPRSFIGSLKRNKNLLVGLPAMSAPVQRSEDNNSNSGGNSANAGGNGNKSRSSSLQQKVKRIYL